MFLLENASRKALLCISRKNGNRLLQEDRSTIGSLVDPVDGAARDRFPRFERAPLGMQTGKLREQGGMDIEDASPVSRNKLRRQQPHIARKADQLRVDRVQDLLDRSFVLPSRREFLSLQSVRRDP